MSENFVTLRGIRIVAIIEAAKAFLILVVGFGLLSLVSHDVSAIAVRLVKHLHLNPASRYPEIFLRAARRVTDANLWFFASVAIIDAGARGFVAYGLWKNREWGKWLGIAAAGIYLPLEIYEMYHHLTLLKAATFATNVAIVVYLGFELRRSRRIEDHARVAIDASSE